MANDSRLLDPVFLQVHLPSLNLLYLNKLIFFEKPNITHVLHMIKLYYSGTPLYTKTQLQPKTFESLAELQ